MLRSRDAAATRCGGNGDRNRGRDGNGDDDGDRDRDGDGDGDGDDDGDGNDAPCASPPPFKPTDVAFGARATVTWPATAPGGALPTAAELRAALSARRLEHDQEAIVVFTTLRDAPAATEGYAGPLVVRQHGWRGQPNGPPPRSLESSKESFRSRNVGVRADNSDEDAAAAPAFGASGASGGSDEASASAKNAHGETIVPIVVYDCAWPAASPQCPGDTLDDFIDVSVMVGDFIDELTPPREERAPQRSDGGGGGDETTTEEPEVTRALLAATTQRRTGEEEGGVTPAPGDGTTRSSDSDHDNNRNSNSSNNNFADDDANAAPSSADRAYADADADAPRIVLDLQSDVDREADAPTPTPPDDEHRRAPAAARAAPVTTTRPCPRRVDGGGSRLAFSLREDVEHQDRAS